MQGLRSGCWVKGLHYQPRGGANSLVDACQKVLSACEGGFEGLVVGVRVAGVLQDLLDKKLEEEHMLTVIIPSQRSTCHNNFAEEHMLY